MEYATSTEANQNIDPEVKRPVQSQDFDLDGLTEWELARLTSKTWSMEQE
jgi:hypothetical protein